MGEASLDIIEADALNSEDFLVQAVRLIAARLGSIADIQQGLCMKGAREHGEINAHLSKIGEQLDAILERCGEEKQ